MRPSKKRLAHFPPRARFHVPRVPALPQLPRARSGARRAHTALDTSAVSARAGQGHDACVVIEHARAVQPEGALRAAARPLFQAPLQHRTFSASKTRMASMIIMKPSFIPPPRRPNRAPRPAPPRPKPPPKRCRGANIAPACMHTALHTPEPGMHRRPAPGTHSATKDTQTHDGAQPPVAPRAHPTLRVPAGLSAATYIPAWLSLVILSSSCCSRRARTRTRRARADQLSFTLPLALAEWRSLRCCWWPAATRNWLTRQEARRSCGCLPQW